MKERSNRNAFAFVLMSVQDYARKHGLTRAGVHYKINRGEVRAVRVGGGMLVEEKLKITKRQ